MSYPWSRGDTLAADDLNAAIETSFAYTDAQISAHYPSGGATVYVGETAPASPQLGALWWKPSINTEYIWNGSSWVQTYAPPGGMAPLASPAFTGTPTAPTAAPGTNTTQLATTAFVAAAAGVASNTNPLAEGIAAPGTSPQYARTDHVHPIVATGNRNVIINGGMDIWQRATNFPSPTSQTFLADRWRLFWDGSGFVCTVLRTLATDALTVNSGHRWLMQYTCSNAGSGGSFRFIEQRIENVNTLSGGQVTLSFIATSNTAMTVAVSMSQFFGTGGSPSSTVGIASQSVSVTSTAQRFSLTFTLPSISGKTLGTNGNDFITVQFQMPLATVGTVWFTGVQLERGSVPTAFEFRPVAQELSICKRYWQQSTTNWTDYGYIGAGAAIAKSILLPVEMRTTPLYNYIFTTQANASGGTVGGDRENIVFQAAGIATGAYGLSVVWNASAEL